jgi:hypothetical protein
MIAAPRLIRTAGVFALGLAALVVGGGQAFANCTLAFGPNSGMSGQTLTITKIAGDLSGTSSVMIGSNTATILAVSTGAVTVTIPTEPTPTVTSITTIVGNHGSTSGGDAFTITGTNFNPTVNVTIAGSASCDGTYSNAFQYNDVTAVDIGGTAAPSFTVTPLSTTQITGTTPPGIAGVTNVEVFTTNNNSGGSGNNIFAYIPGGPSVTGVGPQLGLTTVAQPVTISGNNFISGTFANGTPATKVTFNCNGVPNTQPLNATVTSIGSIALTAPTCGTAGADQVTVTTPGGSSSGTYQYVAPGTPSVTSISPSTGTLLGGTQVTISGSNFIGATAVMFGSTPITGFQINSGASITAVTPAVSTAGPVTVSVTVTSGASTLTSTGGPTFTYTTPPPVVNSISPSTGSTAGGTAVTIAGQNFTGATAVTIGGTSVSSFAVTNDGQITAITAPHAAGIGLTVQVTTPSGNGTGVAPAGVYTYGTPAPTVLSITPNSGAVGGGQSVTITGTAFTGTTSVTFGGTTATSFNVVSDTSITAVTPSHAAGIVSVAVTTAAGTGTGSNLYSYAASPPTVASISPNTGTTLGGTAVTITGTNFTGTPQVTIGKVAAAEVTVVNSTTLTAVTPAGTGSNVPVVVTTSFGTSIAANIYSYAAPVAPTPPAPTVTSVSPGSGTTLGLTPVTITGTNFTGATAVTFGLNSATNVTVVNSTKITALTPPGTLGSVAVAVTTPGGTGTAAAAYRYITAAPAVTAVNASTGTSLGGSVVTITGTNFTGATGVTFGGNPATSVTVVSSTTITALTPPGTAGPVAVAVTTPAGTGTGANLFTYLVQASPTVTAISPNGGSIANGGNTAGGTSVTITGTNFTGATSVTIGGTPATFMVVVSSTSITAVTPAHAPGAVNVVVMTPAGPGTGTNLFTYVAPAPTVTAISPSGGPTAGGTAVTITGTNFTGATLVTIGGNTPTAVTFVSSTSITATTPAHAAGAVNVVVTTPAGTGTATNLFTYNAPASVVPTVTTVTPSKGPPGGGTQVTITGTNLTGVTAVMFGGANATIFTVVSATSITARSPAGSGTVAVTVTTAAGTSAAGPGDQFSYSKATTTTALTSSPNPSAVGQLVTFTARVTGNNPTGTVTFSESGRPIGTAMLVNGVATFMISTLPAGSNAVTASYPGDANNAPDPETVIQVVSVSANKDSANLRQMQLAVMPVVSNLSGQAISGAIDNAISTGFGGACQLLSPNGGGFTYCIDGDAPMQSNSMTDESHLTLDDRQRLEKDFAALGFADQSPASITTPAAPPPPRNWLAWIDVRGADFRTEAVGSDLAGTQVNATAGITRRFTPDFLVGVLGGYEHFDFTSQAFNGVLKGDGYTAGAYVGWRLASTVRFDASGAWSDITSAENTGTASGNFTGHRWFASAGLTGSYAWQATIVEPSARVYMLWEQENAYTDSLGSPQASHTFDTGRGSVGVKVSHMFPAGDWTLAPYVGLYGDYYFSNDDATTPPGLTAAAPILQGGAARATGGVTMMFGGGAQLTVGAEYSGLGQDTRIWNLQLHGNVPF